MAGECTIPVWYGVWYGMVYGMVWYGTIDRSREVVKRTRSTILGGEVSYSNQ